jgi:hypothetical protein
MSSATFSYNEDRRDYRQLEIASLIPRFRLCRWLHEFSALRQIVLHRKLAQANQKQDVMLFSRKVSRVLWLAGHRQIQKCGAR